MRVDRPTTTVKLPRVVFGALLLSVAACQFDSLGPAPLHDGAVLYWDAAAEPDGAASDGAASDGARGPDASESVADAAESVADASESVVDAQLDADVDAACVPEPIGDRCDGLDDDCDPATADGAGDPLLGVACDGVDLDLCAEGAWVCMAGELVCDEAPGDDPELCNGIDDDCDPTTGDGADDGLIGLACDGPDDDLCLGGVWHCAGGAPLCDDDPASAVDLCNSSDDDCDPASADGADDPLVGARCDGPDSDRCPEGEQTCESGLLTCSDFTGGAVDECNGVDDDCDPATADGAGDVLLGASCDGLDGDLCTEGVTVCLLGAPACGDVTDTSVESCNAIDDDCDGMTDDGFHNTDPVCEGAPLLGTVVGNAAPGGLLTATAGSEAFYRVRITDSSGGTNRLHATITLLSGAGADYDLHVRCLTCAGALASSSTVRGPASHTDTVGIRRDTGGSDDSFDVRIEVRHQSGASCAPWTLVVTGNVAISGIGENCPN